MNEYEDDPLAAARGTMFAVLFSLPLWLAGYGLLIAFGACDSPL